MTSHEREELERRAAEIAAERRQHGNYKPAPVPLAPVRPERSAFTATMKALGITAIILIVVCGGLGFLLSLMPKSKPAPEHKVDEEALRQALKGPLADEKIPPEQARQLLKQDYLERLQIEFRAMNHIEVKLIPVKGGFGLFGVHSYFTSKTFDLGSEAKGVQNWINFYRGELYRAKIMRVGVKSSEGLGECWYEVKQSLKF